MYQDSLWRVTVQTWSMQGKKSRVFHVEIRRILYRTRGVNSDMMAGCRIVTTGFTLNAKTIDAVDCRIPKHSYMNLCASTSDSRKLSRALHSPSVMMDAYARSWLSEITQRVEARARARARYQSHKRHDHPSSSLYVSLRVMHAPAPKSGGGLLLNMRRP